MGWRCLATCSTTKIFGDSSGCYLLGLFSLIMYAADSVVSIPLAIAQKLLKTLIIGLMVQKLIMAGIKAAKITDICFPF